MIKFKTLGLVLVYFVSGLGAAKPPFFVDVGIVRSFSTTPLYSSGNTIMEVNAQITGNEKLDIEIEIANETYKSGQLIASFSMTRSGTKVIDYDNRYTRQSNHLILRIVDNAKNTVSAYKVQTVFGGTKNVVLDENKGFTSQSDIIVFKPSTGETLREKEVLNLEGFDDYYIPPYYHNFNPSKLVLKQDSIINSKLICNSVAFQITNRNGVFNEISNKEKILINMKTVKDEPGKYHLEFADPLYVNKKTLKMSSQPKQGYVKTKYLYFPINEMQYQDEYQAAIAFKGLGIDRYNFAYSFKMNALINTVGDCHNSEYCVLSD